MIKPILIIIAGPNGSGKTSITNKLLNHKWVEECVYINPDNIAKDLFGDWNNKDAVLKAAVYSTKLREECLQEMKSLIFETVLSSTEKVSFIEKAKQLGYFIRLFFIGTDSPTINASRIAQRVIDGGHDVPISKIISRYAKSIINCAACAKIANRTYIYDNSIDFADPQILFKISEGSKIKEYKELNIWAKPILEFIKKKN